MKSTEIEVLDAIEELKNAMIENIKITQEEEKVKLAKIKAHKRLLLAKEALHNIEQNI